ncbi:MAG: DUF4188 domain-containing protein [Longimicrobiales bacterium]|nr:DUF4188 domain-containing protein [Longimicrobiales bacterium]
MARVKTGRFTTDLDEDFAVFLIGMRVNSLWKIHKWLPVFLAMPRMLKELEEQDERGLLGYRTRWGFRNVEVIQYWRSLEALLAYAHHEDAEHVPAWADFNQRIGDDGSVGIWHEAYQIQDGHYETLYRHMPPHGLGAATPTVEATGSRRSAADRLEDVDVCPR